MSETVAGSPYTPPLPPRFPLRLVYTEKYVNVFECTQPYFVLLQETLNFFSLLSRGGLGPPGPPSGYAPVRRTMQINSRPTEIIIYILEAKNGDLR